jgi:hypothetical protein
MPSRLSAMSRTKLAMQQGAPLQSTAEWALRLKRSPPRPASARGRGEGASGAGQSQKRCAPGRPWRAKAGR